MGIPWGDPVDFLLVNKIQTYFLKNGNFMVHVFLLWLNNGNFVKFYGSCMFFFGCGEEYGHLMVLLQVFMLHCG